MTTHETLIQELQDALKRERQLRMTAQGKLALAREPEYEALKVQDAESDRLRKALQKIAGSRFWVRVRGIAIRALK